MSRSRIRKCGRRCGGAANGAGFLSDILGSIGLGYGGEMPNNQVKNILFNMGVPAAGIDSLRKINGSVAEVMAGIAAKTRSGRIRTNYELDLNTGKYKLKPQFRLNRGAKGNAYNASRHRTLGLLHSGFTTANWGNRKTPGQHKAARRMNGRGGFLGPALMGLARIAAPIIIPALAGYAMKKITGRGGALVMGAQPYGGLISVRRRGGLVSMRRGMGLVNTNLGAGIFPARM